MFDTYNGKSVGLVVRSAFERYTVGQHIIDKETVEQILSSEHANSVDKILIDAYPQNESTETPIKDTFKKKEAK